MILTTTQLPGERLRRSPAVSIGPIQLLVALVLLLPVSGHAQVVPQGKEREPLGSLTSMGEVYVNDSLAPAELTVFSGDRVRAASSSSATFNMSGKGSLKLSPGSQVLFAGKYEYAAELQAGAVAMNSVSGPNGLTLRIGNDVVVPSIKERTALASIDRAPDGSFLVTCSDGAVGVLALQGSSGQFLQVGQSVSIAPNGELFPVVEQGVTAGKTSSLGRKANAGGSHTGWVYVGLAAAGAAGTAAALSHGGGKQSISPSSP